MLFPDSLEDVAANRAASVVAREFAAGESNLLSESRAFSGRYSLELSPELVLDGDRGPEAVDHYVALLHSSLLSSLRHRPHMVSAL